MVPQAPIIIIIIIIIIVYSLGDFHGSSNWSLIPWSFLSILADLCRAVVWMVLILPLIYSTLSLFSRILGIVPKAPTMTGITVTFMFPNFFSSLAISRFLLDYFTLKWSIFE